MILSIFGWVSLVIISYIIVSKKINIKGFITLLIILFLQTYFAFIFLFNRLESINNVLVFLLIVALFLFIIYLLTRYFKVMDKYHEYFKKSLISLCLIGLVYTEFFNGSITFHSWANYQEYEGNIKKYYFIVPVNISSFEFVGEQVCMISYLPFHSKIIKVENNKVFYYEPRGFGEGGDWWEYGKKKAEQI
ncbi:hypothetical protein [Cytobacillus dafuensis]|uniref:Uncharacterized protein n=1 Tax=Cytobacillus dafuensis TaxID=1742359 RepID=A0A5B8Z502_CYTDA|nr:hypothetical protein [Cytobacillus dafuensis]QED46406.1 hypothetical protein FSZ17_03505 [Cytobacillus dafuensis]